MIPVPNKWITSYVLSFLSPFLVESNTITLQREPRILSSTKYLLNEYTQIVFGGSGLIRLNVSQEENFEILMQDFVLEDTTESVEASVDLTDQGPARRR